MASAIELYQRAYDLDYRKGDWEYAEELYKEIIERYPYSEEKEYAQVHLDRLAKLKSNPDDQALQPVRAKGGGGLVAFLFLLILIVMVGTGFLGYFLWQQHQRQDSNEFIVHGLLSEKTGNYNDARMKYEQAQKIYPKNSLAYRCLAELYLKQGKKNLAEIECKQWELACPYDVNVKDFKERVKKYQNEKDNEQ